MPRIGSSSCMIWLLCSIFYSYSAWPPVYSRKSKDSAAHSCNFQFKASASGVALAPRVLPALTQPGSPGVRNLRGPGVHLTGKVSSINESKCRTVLAQRGDVLLIRPLVEHNSVPSRSGSLQHRRILHLEFAGSPDLPDGYEWHDYVPGCIPPTPERGASAP